ncbi:MAG: DUF4395 domain-containing protein [Proteobacteria bacterium]|nr:DUF4395 domain-containing protein [Pseudomonadota bacterium]
MKEMCPISFSQINERAGQINAALAIFSMLLFFFTDNKWIIWVLTADFFIRGFLDPSYSFYGAVSKTILGVFKIKPLMVNAGPKIFAAKIGFIFCCMIAISHLIDSRAMGLAVGSLFMICAGLEAIFRFCVACKIYPLINKWG